MLGEALVVGAKGVEATEHVADLVDGANINVLGGEVLVHNVVDALVQRRLAHGLGVHGLVHVQNGWAHSE